MLPLTLYLNATIINKKSKVLATGISNGTNSNNTPNTVSGMSTRNAVKLHPHTSPLDLHSP